LENGGVKSEKNPGRGTGVAKEIKAGLGATEAIVIL
jgi:hypothetical protein